MCPPASALSASSASSASSAPVPSALARGGPARDPRGRGFAAHRCGVSGRGGELARGARAFLFGQGRGVGGGGEAEDEDEDEDEKGEGAGLLDVPDASMTKHENVLLGFFLEDLGVRLRVALNEGEMGLANALQEKLSEVEDAVKVRAERQEAGAATAGAGEQSSEQAPGEGQGTLGRVTSEDLDTLRGEMQRAVEEERYADAAQLRDQLKELATGFRAYSDYAVALGDLVEHTVYGYGGVVVGMEPACKETAAWADASGVTDAAMCPRGVNQPFYIVLVDSRDAGDDPPQVAYCPEDWLAVRDRRAEELERLQVSLGRTEADGGAQRVARGGAQSARARRAADRRATFSVEHPYLYKLFYGQSHEGAYLPTRRLKALYGAIHDK